MPKGRAASAPDLPISRASTNEPCSGNMGSIVFAVVPPRPLEPPATELVWASVVVVLIYAALWVVVVKGSLSLRRDGLTRWATTMLVVSVLFSPLAGIVVYAFGRSEGQGLGRTAPSG
jgi:hypothetical protein